MTLQEEAAELVRTRIALDTARAAYESQRLTVHNALVNSQQTSVAAAGYRISHTVDSTSRSIKLDLLRGALLRRGIAEAVATDIIVEATIEVQRSGVISMYRLPEIDTDIPEA